MQLDLARTSRESARMLRANLDVVTALAGMFILLPGLISSWMLPVRAVSKKTPTLIDILNANAAYVEANWPIMLASALIVGFGTLALLVALIHRSRPTVAGAMKIAIAALPIYMVTNIMQSAMVLVGIAALVLPGLYLIARFICIAPVVAVEGERNPIAVVRRSIELTRGNGWKILLLFGVIVALAMIFARLVLPVVGIMTLLVMAPDLARFVQIVAGGLLDTALAVVILVVSATVYNEAVVSERR